MKKLYFLCKESDKNILSVILDPYQWFISDFSLISSPITCRENEKFAFPDFKEDFDILSVILSFYHPLISKKRPISRCARVRTFLTISDCRAQVST